MVLSGKRGIRTPEPVLPVTRFPGVPYRFVTFLILNNLQTHILGLARILHAHTRIYMVISLQQSTLSKEKPACRDTIITHQIREPGNLEQVAIRLLLAGVHIPPIDAVAVGEGFLATDDMQLLQKLKSNEEAMHNTSGIITLHKPNV